MTGLIAKPTIDGIRLFTSRIDPSVEALMDAHGFAFTSMNASDNHVSALYCRKDGGSSEAWQLSLNHRLDDEMSISLNKMKEDQQLLALSILVGTELTQTLAEAIGLAVSFVAVSDQIKASSEI
jgi:hypothetical protein